jgi:hypothetical protein
MKITKLILILIVTSIGLQSCFMDNDDLSNLAYEINPKDLIKKDSDLFNLIVMVTNTEGNPLNNIVCIRFSYSFLIFTYDENLEIIGETVISNDSQFNTLLANLPQNHSISLSYPIETTLVDGTPFSITTNEELKEAINACAQDEIIGYCSGLFLSQQCAWKVPFIDGADNTYASGVFSVNNNTSVTFDFQNNEYTGTWIFFFIEGVLNFNINLAGNSQVAQDWNINFNVDYVDNTLLLTSDTKNYYIKLACEFTDEFELGQKTPLGGIVGYDKGAYEKGWRYIEAHYTDLPTEEWGCLSGDIAFAEFEDIGGGFMSSAAIANYHLDLNDYLNNPGVCNPNNDGTVSALTALLLGQNSPIGNPDWFLPSIEELLKLYENLHLEGLGNFENEIYWSSTQSNESHAKALDFSTGDIVEIPKNSPSIRARAVRYF